MFVDDNGSILVVLFDDVLVVFFLDDVFIRFRSVDRTPGNRDHGVTAREGDDEYQ